MILDVERKIYPNPDYKEYFFIRRDSEGLGLVEVGWNSETTTVTLPYLAAKLVAEAIINCEKELDQNTNK
jgi:hypothetical protein